MNTTDQFIHDSWVNYPRTARQFLGQGRNYRAGSRAIAATMLKTPMPHTHVCPCATLPAILNICEACGPVCRTA